MTATSSSPAPDVVCGRRRRAHDPDRPQSPAAHHPPCGSARHRDGSRRDARLRGFLDGARDNVAVASVLVSQFATISVVVAYVLFRERLGRLQVVGAVLLVVGVTALSLVSS